MRLTSIYWSKETSSHSGLLLEELGAHASAWSAQVGATLDAPVAWQALLALPQAAP